MARDGVEPPMPAFSAALSKPNHVFNQQLNSSEWAIYCDHSVTSADVRLILIGDLGTWASRSLVYNFVQVGVH